MTMIEILPIAGAALIVFVAILIIRGDGNPEKGLWIVPALFCILFLAWTLGSIIQEGLLGFWPEHTRNMWGNQIWFDLLISICIGWFLLAHKARSLGMRLPFWLIFIVFTGSVGLSAMLARYLYLQQHSANPS